MGYANGQIPDGALVTIARDARLLAGPAAAWVAIVAEVKRRYGWTPRPTGMFDGYRPLEGNYYAQTETFLRRYERRTTGNGPYGDVRYWKGVRYVRVNGAAAAVPGTSNHGWACAVDVADLLSFTSERYRQFAAVAAEYGWTNTEGRSIGEYWHWVDVGNAHLVKNGLTEHGVVPDIPTPAPPAPIVPEEDIVASLQDLQNVTVASEKRLQAAILTAVAAVGSPRAYRIADTDGAYLDLGSARRALSGQQHQAMDPRPPIRPLPASDAFWSLPLVGPPSQAFRLSGDTTGAVWYVEDGGRRHVGATEYAEDGKPPLKDLPATNAVWSLPVLGSVAA